MSQGKDEKRPTERKPCAVKAARTVSTGGMGKRPYKDRASSLPTKHARGQAKLDFSRIEKVADYFFKQARNRHTAACRLAYGCLHAAKPRNIRWGYSK
jgi:hypothetical protein